ncbi:hypothetical protein [Variovorax sp. Root434]|uniref:hypothetical protein n=1 Tax=Variovorax sp. Root434 TaxID=1736536 RepID=UPI0012F80979|nr:hypothetical protein [Variovorax sp. Root434]
MTAQPMFTEACLATSIRPGSRRDILALLNDRLHPALQAIVAAEVLAGNRICDAGTDWPDPGSVHITLAEHFDGRHASAQAAFSPCDDPHYWHAHYSTTDKPRHLLTC